MVSQNSGKQRALLSMWVEEAATIWRQKRRCRADLEQQDNRGVAGDSSGPTGSRVEVEPDLDAKNDVGGPPWRLDAGSESSAARNIGMNQRRLGHVARDEAMTAAATCNCVGDPARLGPAVPRRWWRRLSARLVV